jgi:hypothetical protein
LGYLERKDQEDQGSKPAGANSLTDPILKKNPTQKNRVDGVTQEVEYLPSKCEPLSSNTSATKKKNNNNNKNAGMRAPGQRIARSSPWVRGVSIHRPARKHHGCSE